VVEDLRPEAAPISIGEARSALGKETRTFRKWGEVVALRYTSYDVFHRGEGSVPATLLSRLLLPFRYVLAAPLFGLPEVVEARFSSGRTWKKEFRRRWLWFLPLQESLAREYCESLVKLHGTGKEALARSGGRP
jgi:hypothetical protein